MKKVVIWGLKTDVHSHKFIHMGYYQNFQDMGFDPIGSMTERLIRESFVKTI